MEKEKDSSDCCGGSKTKNKKSRLIGVVLCDKLIIVILF